MAEHENVELKSGDVGLSHPRFIIHAGGKYYLTLAVWEYDPSASDLPGAQMLGVTAIAADYASLCTQGQERGAVEIPKVHIGYARLSGGTQTNPAH